MENRRPAMTEEMKTFVQEGLHNYAAACLALAEFRRQVRSRLQAVLDDYSAQFSELGLTVSGCRSNGPKLDDPDMNEKSSWIGLRKNHGDELYSGCDLEWNLEESQGKKAWVGIWVYSSRARADRDHLFSALQERHRAEGTDLDQLGDGAAYLSAYIDENYFYDFEVVFRSLVEAWIELLSGVGGISPFASALRAPAPQLENEEV